MDPTVSTDLSLEKGALLLLVSAVVAMLTLASANASAPIPPPDEVR